MKWVSARVGDYLNVRQRPVSFSFYPTFQGEKREGVHSILFSTDPWNLIQHRLEGLDNIEALVQSNAFLVQARDFYKAAFESDISAAKPLLLYYSFLNLAKCYCVYKTGSTLATIKHGVTEKLPVTNGAIHGSVSFDVLKNPTESAFIKFANALGAPIPTPANPKTSISIRSQDLFSQILVGHRIYCQSESIKERFISLKDIRYKVNNQNKECWIKLSAYADDFTRHGYPLSDLSNSIDKSKWKNTSDIENENGRRIIFSEMISPEIYANRPSESIQSLSDSIRNRLWRSVTSYPPYRKYYIYKQTSNQVVLNQILTMYLATFYLGSITRYKPEKFSELLSSSIGPFIYEFFANQPSQFLYLMASEFMKQEVAKAAIA